MRNKLLPAAIAAALMTPFAVSADPIHNFAELGYRNIDGNEDGFGFRGSLVIVPQLHLWGDAHRVTDGPLRRDQGSLLLGWHHGFMQNTDLVLRGGWTRARDRVGDVDNALDDFFDFIDNGEVTTQRDNGFVAQAGLRSMVTDQLEVNGYVMHEDIYGGNTAVALGAVFNFMPTMGVTGLVELGENDTIYQVGLRFSFDGQRFGLPER